MISSLYLAGLTSWPDLNDVDYRWLLLDDTYTLDPVTHTVVADLTGELTDPSYGRVALTGSSVTVTYDDLGPVVMYDADDPTFPGLSGATDAAWLILARHVTNDADSPLLGAWAIDYNPTGADFTPLISAQFGLHVHTVVTEAYWPGL